MCLANGARRGFVRINRQPVISTGHLPPLLMPCLYNGGQLALVFIWLDDQTARAVVALQLAKALHRWRIQIGFRRHSCEARAFLNWSVRELSQHSGVSQSSISRAERAKAGRGMRTHNVSALKANVERFGIEFLGGCGLKWVDGQEPNVGVTEQLRRQPRLDGRSKSMNARASRRRGQSLPSTALECGRPNLRQKSL